MPAGNGTEIAMLKWLQDNEVSVQDQLAKRERQGEFECKIPFGPVRKRETTVIRPWKGCSYVRVVCKGAPEYVARFCTNVLRADGEIAPLIESPATLVDENIIQPFAKQLGLRTLAYAYKDMDSKLWEELQDENNNFVRESDRDIIERDLVFVAGFGIRDDLRKNVDKAIARLKTAGINTRMISGDNIETAISVAKKAGILKEGEEAKSYMCMTGEEFIKYIGGVNKTVGKDGKERWGVGDKKRFKIVAENLKVLARTTPEDKFALVVGL